jgi:hypothetical protein
MEVPMRDSILKRRIRILRKAFGKLPELFLKILFIPVQRNVHLFLFKEMFIYSCSKKCSFIPV